MAIVSGSDDVDGFPKTATANEEFVDLIQQWQKDKINRDIIVVVSGKSGAGKSTLINNFLTLDKHKAAKTGLQPTSVTKDVDEYKGEVNGIPIQAIDVPGLNARDHNKDKLAKIVATLTHLTGGKADILIYCIPLTQRLDVVDERNIHTLNKVFGEIIWTNAVIALTHADRVLDEQEVGEDYDLLLASFTKEIQVILRDSGVLAHVTLHSFYNKIDVTLRSDPAQVAPNSLGTSVDPNPDYNFTIIGIPTGKNPSNPQEWRQVLLSQLITIGLKNVGSIIMELNGMKWREVADLLKEEALAARFNARACEYGSNIGLGTGIVLGTILGVAFADDVVTTPTAVGVVAGGAGGVLGRAIGLLGGHGVAALRILARGMTHPRNQARAKDIAFYIKVNKKLKKLRDGLQE